MLLLLSPAKSFDASPAPAALPHSKPLFVAQAAELIDILRQYSPAQIAQLMHLSDSLSGLNVARYQAWSSTFNGQNSKQAVLAFNGDVYRGLDAKSLDAKSLAWLQEHVCILSGLYGVLRPLDYMQPYRLEMGTRLTNARGANLYDFWRGHIAHYLNLRQQSQAQPVLVNLASAEYFKAVDSKALQARVVHCVFEERRGQDYKIVSLHAKRARGLMARFAAQNGLQKPEQLRDFAAEGYAFDAAASSPDRLLFRRDAAARS